ncbi:MAG: HD domain-containing protein [Planctomycetota bacterium]|nr:HD domain-containing protein [Planctomycetota bacterium]
MLRVPIVEAREGMILAEPVLHPGSARTVLLRTGARLESHAITRLREMGVRELWVRVPGLDDLVRIVDPQFRDSCRELTQSLAASMDGAIAGSSVEVDFRSYRRTVMGMIERLVMNPRAGVFLSELGDQAHPPARHAGNVCALSLMMGLKLDFYLVRERARLAAGVARDISPLGVGALFHDIGMTRLSPDALERWNRTFDESDPAWREHPALGFDLVKDSLEPAAAAVVLHHHQRWDGEGFPCIPTLEGACVPPRASGIHVFARIVAVAETFERFRHPAHAPGARDDLTPPRPAVRALAMMRRAETRARLDPVVLRALAEVAPPYPPGSLVTLSDGRRGAVVTWTAEDPCRPTVEILGTLTPSRRAEARRERIDLRATTDLHVAEIDGHAVAGDNFEPLAEDISLSTLCGRLDGRQSASAGAGSPKAA